MVTDAIKRLSRYFQEERFPSKCQINSFSIFSFNKLQIQLKTISLQHYYKALYYKNTDLNKYLKIMSSKISHLLNILTCEVHQSQPIVQVCVSTNCTQPSKLCCLQCVDEHHSGADHILMSTKKFTLLLQEFHVIVDQKKEINSQLLDILQKQKLKLNQHVQKFYRLIEDSLTKENQIASYEQIDKNDWKSLSNKEINAKISQLITNHSWLLQLNFNSFRGQKITESTGQEEENVRATKQIIHTKYDKLQKKLQEIFDKAEKEIKQCIQKHETEVKKFFHLFDEVKYKVDDDGRELQHKLKHSKEHSKNLSATPLDSPVKEQLQSPNKQTTNSYFDFFNTISG